MSKGGFSDRFNCLVFRRKTVMQRMDALFQNVVLKCYVLFLARGAEPIQRLLKFQLDQYGDSLQFLDSDFQR